jgi:8-oxo-dGTP diphosphatase
MAGDVRIRVAALIVKAGSLLLVKHSKDGSSYWMPPGGGVDSGETLSEALVRELHEELALEVEVGALVLASDAISPDRDRHIVNLFFTARVLSGEPQRGTDPRISGFGYHDIEALHELELFPAVAPVLQQILRQHSPPHAVYLGNLWKT